MPRDERFELGNDLPVATEGEVRVDAILDRSQSHLREPGDLGLCERLVGELRERFTPPERKRLPELRARVNGVCGARVLDQTLEMGQIELVRSNHDGVAGGTGDENLRTQMLTQPRNVDLESLGGRSGRVPSPELLDQPVCGDDLVRMEEHEREQGTLVAASEPDGTVIVDDLQRPENPELHCPPGDATTLFCSWSTPPFTGRWRSRG